jgi:hypothetical protein
MAFPPTMGSFRVIGPVLQQAPAGEAESQLPPEEVEVVMVKPKFAPVLEIASTSGNGSGAPKGLVK